VIPNEMLIPKVLSAMRQVSFPAIAEMCALNRSDSSRANVAPIAPNQRSV
jgi:hypothetical protein